MESRSRAKDHPWENRTRHALGYAGVMCRAVCSLPMVYDEAIRIQDKAKPSDNNFKDLDWNLYSYN